MIRPAGSGAEASASLFMRTLVSPRAALLIVSNAIPPEDWPAGESEIETNLGHALGYTCEVRRDDIVVLNPLGEGIAKAPLPELTPDWLDNVRHDGSCAVYLAPTDSDSGFAELTIASAASAGSLAAATVRTAIDGDAGKQKPVGRNEPCPCGSGKKFKHCHG